MLLQTTESNTTEIPDLVTDEFESFFNTNSVSDQLDQDDAHTNGVAYLDTEDTHDTVKWFDEEMTEKALVPLFLLSKCEKMV